ncbi:MAG: NAD(+)/NADH kinase [Anaerolineae bacterium]|nr:NAD(+)/NADH kinase [Anaerolineae bacterium]
MKTVGILYHPGRPESQDLGRRVGEILDEAGIQIWRGSAGDDERLQQAAADLDLLVTLGGDGTIVRAIRQVARFDVPILGVNLGRLGFLAEVEPDRLEPAIAKVLAGDCIIEERMMLRSELWRGEELLLESQAINDIVVARGMASRMVHISVEVDGRHVMTPAADGVIVSTPTGSTAYCLAAGGPIVAPDVPGLTITPIAAHLGIAHALVIPATRSLCLRLVKGQGAMVTVDGQIDVPLEVGDRVLNTESACKAKFVRFGGDGYFYETVLSRLGWPDRQPGS